MYLKVIYFDKIFDDFYIFRVVFVNKYVVLFINISFVRICYVIYVML